LSFPIGRQIEFSPPKGKVAFTWGSRKTHDKYAKRERFIFFVAEVPKPAGKPDTNELLPGFSHAGKCDRRVTALWHLIDMQMVRIRV